MKRYTSNMLMKGVSSSWILKSIFNITPQGGATAVKMLHEYYFNFRQNTVRHNNSIKSVLLFTPYI